mmetsp:Transcript_17262/g.12336  ORF Transcript_17262/g.12336 Transcript_17262/m.12336 type:complete len:115 (-) Transcript_17262:798-1142(-)
MIGDFKQKLHYVPTKLFYNEVGLETSGYYSVNNEASSDSTLNLQALIDSWVEMENLIKKNFKLSEEKMLKFTEVNPVQITLREELELVYKERKQLLEENNNLKMNMIQNKENNI